MYIEAVGSKCHQKRK